MSRDIRITNLWTTIQIMPRFQSDLIMYRYLIDKENFDVNGNKNFVDKRQGTVSYLYRMNYLKRYLTSFEYQLTQLILESFQINDANCTALQIVGTKLWQLKAQYLLKATNIISIILVLSKNLSSFFWDCCSNRYLDDFL